MERRNSPSKLKIIGIFKEEMVHDFITIKEKEIMMINNNISLLKHLCSFESIIEIQLVLK